MSNTTKKKVSKKASVKRSPNHPDWVKKGTAVTVDAESENAYEAVIENVLTNGRIRVSFGEENESKVLPMSRLKLRKRGRLAISEEFTPNEVQAQINDLINELRSAKDQEQKKAIRRALRRRGHSGGLRSLTK